MMTKNDSGLNFTGDDVLNMISAVNDFIAEVGRVYNQYNNQPATNSTAIQEMSTFSDQEQVNAVYSMGMLSLESAADHLMVFVDSVAEPAKTLAPWTCVRGLLESCALAAWFLDPTIDVQTRVGRCFAFRYEGFVQQIKLFQVIKQQAEIDKVKQRIQKVEQEALALGYPPLPKNSSGISGIAQRHPSITEMIGKTLDREFDYRLFSAVAHGHHWALQQIGFRVVEVSIDGVNQKGLEKHPYPGMILYPALVAISSYAKGVWYLWRLYGWNLKELEDTLTATYDRLKINRELRFWLTATSNQ